MEIVYDKKVYHLSWPFYSILLLLDLVVAFAIIEGLISLMQSSQNIFAYKNIMPYFLFFLFFVLFIYLFWVIYQVRLELTNDGITFYTWGYRMYTPWHNVLGIEKIQNDTRIIMLRSFTGLRLRQNYIYGLKLEEGRRMGIAVFDIDWWIPMNTLRILDYIFPIIFSIGGHHWPRKALGKDIQRYAPWLFLAFE